MKLQKVYFPFLLTLAIPMSFVLLLSLLGVSKTFDRKLSDALFASLPTHYKMSDQIVIIDIDEQSIAKHADDPELGQWPWKRTVYPTLLSYVNILAPPKLTIIDIMFTERSDRDFALVEANQTIGKVSHAANFRSDISTIVNPLIEQNAKRFLIDLPADSPFPKYGSASLPIGEIFTTAPFLHVVNVISDSDGILRRFAPTMKWGNRHFPTLALRAFGETESVITAELEDGTLIVRSGEKERRLPIGKDGMVRAYFYTEAELRAIPRYSAAGIIESLNQLSSGAVEDPNKLTVPPDVFENKIVLIGTSAAATHDDVVTPFGLFPGVIAQAVFASNTIQGHTLRELPQYWGFLFTIIVLSLGTLILFYSQVHWLRNIFPILAVALFLGTFYTLYRLDLILPPTSFILSFPISYLIGFAYLTYTEGKDKRKFNSILRNLVDPGVVSQALDDMEALKRGGEWEITAFFSDVAGFSSISEELSASDLARLLNEYLSAMTDILKANSGTLDKYIGDAIVGIYGAPIQFPNHPSLACKSALEMLTRIKDLRKVWIEKMDYTESARKMKFRIGLNCGPAKVGFMGTDSLASYTMMGDTVNLASRLEAAAKDYGVDILVSESIEAACREEYHFRFLDRIRVKGKDAPVKIYGLICKKNEATPELLQGETIYQKSFLAYTEQRWEEAIRGFEQSFSFFGEKDVAAQMLIERCQVLFKEPPPGVWDGVFTRTSK
ncbi:adenylate/guanylate cyclase domain-containing protein [Leptospira ognonensis]|uniref:Adenylate/guanylate cyclase domain-containing protein n=1 Tax=Leptospira ognonensis TaxID=2484945 RepID=A0A4R9K7Y3_9LEPT|nr:adenylate/guanylate cyclase domain-containing protein [Leptospira ognonensis]TGL61777.1 adenylate/guanylate cyclase domain-containing protein [Leptospira ognonensis]